MKFKYSTTPPLRGAVLGTVQTKITKPSPHTGYAQRAPNNYHTKHGNFPLVNETIKALDSTFQTLPVLGPPWNANQQAWNNANTYYHGWELCSCKHGTHDGQSLYRNWNLNRSLLGLAVIDSPLLEDTTTVKITEIGANQIDPGPPYAMYYIWNPAGYEAYWFANLGNGLNSPIFYCTNSGTNIFTEDPPSPALLQIYAFAYNFGTADLIPFCSFSPTGRPMRSFFSSWRLVH